MKRSYWMIAISLLALLIIGAVVAMMIISVPKAGAPSGEQPKTTTGPLALYFVAVDDNGESGKAIGCGDSAILVTTEEVTTEDVIKSTFERLLSNHNQYYGDSGLYNTLYNSNLSYISSTIVDNKLTVRLSGNLSLGGVCDNPRVEAQLEMTAQAASGLNNVEIFINDKSLDEILSLK